MAARYRVEQDTGNILRVPLAGGTPTTVLTALGASWVKLAQDATTLYSIDQLYLRKAPKAGGDFTQLFNFSGEMDALLPASVAVDDESVYWTVPALQVILKLPK